jgi:antitoxin component YwqK of YwqJK toxin-antitoxin module
MKNILLLSGMIFLLFACRINRQDQHGRRQGKWKVYYDDANKHLFYKGFYKDHHPVKNWKYITPDGRIYMREKYVKDNWVKTVRYHPNGKKHMEGMARYLVSGDTATYRWEGNWNKYDTLGKLVETDYYKLGKFAWKVN